MAKKEKLPKMKLTLTIGKVTKEMLVEDQSEFLKVPYKVLDGAKVVQEGSHGFPLDTPAAEIKAAMQKLLKTFRSDREQAEQNKGRDAVQKVADETIEEIGDLTIKEK